MQRIIFLLLVAFPAATAAAGDPLIRSGDRVALVGGTLVESLQSEGPCEAALLLEHPDLRVQFRNVGWSGDDVHGEARRVFGEAAAGYARLLEDIAVADPTVAVLGYGFAEASDGVEPARRFAAGLRKLVLDLQERGIRLVILQPFRLPGVKVEEYGEAMEIARRGAAEIAAEFDLPLIDPAAAIVDAGDEAFDEAGLRLSKTGRRHLGRFLAAQLVGQSWSPEEDAPPTPLETRLSEKIADKNAWFFHRFRPMNETYLLLFRKHEQGNNAVEIPQFDPLVEAAEQEIWELAARGKP